jgi:hypothetical protein
MFLRYLNRAFLLVSEAGLSARPLSDERQIMKRWMQSKPSGTGETFNRLWLLGMVIPIAAGIWGAIVGSESARIGITSVLVGIAIAIVIGVHGEIILHSNRIEGRVLNVEASIVPLAAGLSQIPEMKDDVALIVQTAAQTKAKATTSGHNFFFNQIMRRVHEDQKDIFDIGNGIFRCRNRLEELNLLDSALGTCSRKVRAVAALGITEWRGVEWREYFGRYEKHAREHFVGKEAVEHSRIFLLDENDLDDGDMRRMLQLQVDSRVLVRTLNRNECPRDRRNPIVLFDDKLLMLHVKRGEEGDEVRVSFTDDQEEITQAGQIFDLLYEQSTPWTGTRPA